MKNGPVNSTLYQLADRALGGQLADRLRLWHGAGVSRRAAANLLAEELGVELNPVTVHRWMLAVSKGQR